MCWPFVSPPSSLRSQEHLGGWCFSRCTGADYSPLTSLTYMALIMIVVGDVPWNAFAAAAGIGLLPAYITSANTNNYLSAGFGIAAVFAALGLQGGLLRLAGAFASMSGGIASAPIWSAVRL